jgi:hypothetical protein
MLTSEAAHPSMTSDVVYWWGGQYLEDASAILEGQASEECAHALMTSNVFWWGGQYFEGASAILEEQAFEEEGQKMA